MHGGDKGWMEKMKDGSREEGWVEGMRRGSGSLGWSRFLVWLAEWLVSFFQPTHMYCLLALCLAYARGVMCNS